MLPDYCRLNDTKICEKECPNPDNWLSDCMMEKCGINPPIANTYWEMANYTNHTMSFPSFSFWFMLEYVHMVIRNPDNSNDYFIRHFLLPPFREYEIYMLLKDTSYEYRR